MARRSIGMSRRSTRIGRRSSSSSPIDVFFEPLFWVGVSVTIGALALLGLSV